MADIIQFRSGERPAAQRPAAAAGSACEIVIFPGVRYERWPDEEPPAPQPKPRRRRKSGE